MQKLLPPYWETKWLEHTEHTQSYTLLSPISELMKKLVLSIDVFYWNITDTMIGYKCAIIVELYLLKVTLVFCLRKSHFIPQIDGNPISVAVPTSVTANRILSCKITSDKHSSCIGFKKS